jgi:hypothetical protein
MFRHEVARVTTTAAVLQSLDVILFELTKIESALDSAPSDAIDQAARHDVRCRVTALFDGADQLMTLLAETRLESRANGSNPASDG